MMQLVFLKRCSRTLSKQISSRSASLCISPKLRINYDKTLVSTKSLMLPKCFSTKVETMEFQAETRKLLDIVTNSIYTDKEVFLRELISNASDALEKYRYKLAVGEITEVKPANTNADVVDEEDGSINNTPQIRILVDEQKNIVTLIDNGIGMTKEELVANLGTIARSGSKSFVENLRKGSESSREGDNIIGQFGVGFYSSFMVSEKVSVESISALAGESERNILNVWTSDGTGVFTMESREVPSSYQHGTKIIMHMKESCKDFADIVKLKGIIKKYSNFVAFPIRINGEVVNTVQAIWAQDKNSITEQQYEEFYRFVSNAYDKPRYTLHFKMDAPIDLKCLFFIPNYHHEKFGMGRMDPGVNIYSRKVLIENKPKDFLPDWLRFLKGVVDSEDLPLSLSREKPQDSNLLRRIKEVLTRKVIRYFDDQKKNKFDDYKEFYLEYANFLKEGICHDPVFMEQISKLLLFESSRSDEGTLITFDEYISQLLPEEKSIYYIVAPTRQAAMDSPYMETFRKHNKNVLILNSTIDDFVMTNLKEYAGRSILSVENSDIDLEAAKDKTEEQDNSKDQEAAVELDEAQSKELCDWLTTVLGTSKVTQVKTTKRLSDSPAIVTDHQSGSLRKMMRMLETAQNKASILPPQVFEINPKHPLVVSMYEKKQNGEVALAQLVAEQLYDNALIAAGIVDDPRQMLPRLNEILKKALDTKSQ